MSMPGMVLLLGAGNEAVEQTTSSFPAPINRTMPGIDIALTKYLINERMKKIALYN